MHESFFLVIDYFYLKFFKVNFESHVNKIMDKKIWSVESKALQIHAQIKIEQISVYSKTKK
jgi:hypothetical protein